MAKYCPIIDGYVTYLNCLECEDKQCEVKNNPKNESIKEK